MTLATVVIPTHAHAELLSMSLETVQRQSVEDIEIFVVGDGVSDSTRQVVVHAANDDARVRFFDNPKGPRHGEIYRHAALAEARGRVVCYQTDDDLWLRDHVATMLELLDDADIAHGVPLQITPQGAVWIWTGDWSLDHFRQQVLHGANFIPLHCFAHTLDAYRRLPEGWRSAPVDTPTDVHMYRQFLAETWCRAVAGWTPTTIHFPSPDRATWTIGQRADELHKFAAMVRDGDAEEFVLRGALRASASGRAQEAVEYANVERLVFSMRAEVENWAVEYAKVERLEASTRAEVESWAAAHGEAEAAARVALTQLDMERARLAAAEVELHHIRNSRLWRARQALHRLPVIGSVIRSAARVRWRRQVH